MGLPGLAGRGWGGGHIATGPSGRAAAVCPSGRAQLRGRVGALLLCPGWLSTAQCSADLNAVGTGEHQPLNTALPFPCQVKLKKKKPAFFGV